MSEAFLEGYDGQSTEEPIAPYRHRAQIRVP